MAGKYHRTYLREELQAAFEQMQESTGKASNNYFVEAVEAALLKDGFLKEVKKQEMKLVVGPNAGQTVRSRGGRRRRVRSE